MRAWRGVPPLRIVGIEVNVWENTAVGIPTPYLRFVTEHELLTGWPSSFYSASRGDHSRAWDDDRLGRPLTAAILAVILADLREPFLAVVAMKDVTLVRRP